MSRLSEKIDICLCLCKAKVSVLAALSAATGFLLAGRLFTWELFFLGAGVFLMACGAGALNHYQDRGKDALMARTATRPLPLGKIEPGTAFSFSLVLIGSGYTVLFFTGSLAAPLLGFATVLLYNGLYTWWKTRSAYALIPGAIVGALPPAIGWAAAGGSFIDPRLGALCFLFLIWQIPHCLIHVAAFGQEYTRIGLPSLTTVFTTGQMRRLTLHWIMAVAVGAQLITLFGVIISGMVKISIVVISLGYVLSGIKFFMNGKRQDYMTVFHWTSYFMFAVTLLIITDKCLRYIG
ncbi:MAG: protoheme IX farnesyltransferase [Syntrophales bacterium]|nr:protoheme IX farnesyltransferase [Syntrophales bacterium]